MHNPSRLMVAAIMIVAILSSLAEAQVRWKDSTDADFADGLFRNPGGTEDQTQTYGEGESATVILRVGDWWNVYYAYRRQLTIVNNSLSQPIPENYSVYIELDHADMVVAGKSLASGADIRIVYVDGATAEEIDRAAETAWNTATTRVWFRVQAAIPPSGSDSNYWLYYQNQSPTWPPANRSGVYIFWDGCDRPVVDQWEVPSGNWALEGSELRFGYDANTTEEVLPSRTDLVEIPETFDNFMLEVKERLVESEPPAPPAEFRNTAIYFRAGSIQSGYAFRASGQDGNLATLWKITPAGGWEILQQTPMTPPEIDLQYTLKVIAYGNTLEAYYEEDELINIIDATYTTGRIGIYCNSGRYYHDEVKLRSYMQPEPTVTISATEQNARRYIASGTYASDVRDTGLPASSIDRVAWTALPVANTSILADVRASDILFLKTAPAPSEGGTPLTPEWATVSFNDGPTTPDVAGRYQQYRLRFVNDNRWESPGVDDVAINYPMRRGYQRHSGKCIIDSLPTHATINIPISLAVLAILLASLRRRPGHQ